LRSSETTRSLHHRLYAGDVQGSERPRHPHAAQAVRFREVDVAPSSTRCKSWKPVGRGVPHPNPGAASQSGRALAMKTGAAVHPRSPPLHAPKNDRLLRSATLPVSSRRDITSRSKDLRIPSECTAIHRACFQRM
jgi:hypothetical protein